MKNILLIIGVIVIGLVLLAIFGGRGTGSAEYVNDTYGFSLEYPENLDLREYTPESVTLGTIDGEAIDGAVDIRVYTAGGVVYEQYDDFVFDTLRNMCAADSPNETVYCDQIQQRQPFEGASGISGEVLYMRRVHEIFSTGEKEIDGWGPIFIFNIAANVPSSQFAILTIQPPVVLEEEQIDSVMMRQIATSVEIDAVDAINRVRELVLVSDVEASTSSGAIIVDPVEWLEGDEARVAAADDTECDVVNAEECVASLNNNFYIRNTEVEEMRYPITSDAFITLQDNAAPQESTLSDVDEKLSSLGTSLVFAIERNEGGVVERLEEVYLP